MRTAPCLSGRRSPTANGSMRYVRPRVASCTRQSVPKSSVVSTSRPMTSAPASCSAMARSAAGVSTHSMAFCGEAACTQPCVRGMQLDGERLARVSPSTETCACWPQSDVGAANRCASEKPERTREIQGASRRAGDSSASSGKHGWNLLTVPRAMLRAAVAATRFPVQRGEAGEGVLARPSSAEILAAHGEVAGHPPLPRDLLEPCGEEPAFTPAASERVPGDAEHG